jgi:hypothetical protein
LKKCDEAEKEMNSTKTMNNKIVESEDLVNLNEEEVKQYIAKALTVAKEAERVENYQAINSQKIKFK